MFRPPLYLILGLLCSIHTPFGLAATKKPPASKPPAASTPAPSTDKLGIAYLSQAPADSPVLPFYLQAPTDRGAQGARLGIVDDNTTGRFTRQTYALKEIQLPSEGDVVVAFKQLVTEGYRHILVDLPGTRVVELSRLPEAQGVLIYNVGSADDSLRSEGCAANLLHLLPSRAMLADALAQYLNKKRWQKIFLAVGPGEGDRLYASAIKRSAQRFGLKVVAEKTWQHSFDERRTPESEVPVFTQGPDHDVLVVADEAGLFGDYLPYRTWSPRPVVGSQGLVPSAWHYTHEMWGALQLQNRFREQTGRTMNDQDYAAWLAVRAIGEAASRTRSVDFDKIKAYFAGAEFSLAGFKGVPLSFRAWDGQLRQPILLASPRSLVAVAPIEGFLHPKNELDTLGYDQPETLCRNRP
ncbi:ABC transporter substrate-binding protein [Methylococcus sp. EFPC2]|uniref:ABC transporter substrate-binding protein n=1 Tax=Methylococcus sp. EFPC2 TaxID=2812648 RepID=UPI001967BDDE|nr:ABC transporter substrate-binding protein [Methylococcus sp. EFPC2]QSA98219.1 ABC transporter substrate-binding protein [Methylococcus sp. EFPC2]